MATLGIIDPQQLVEYDDRLFRCVGEPGSETATRVMSVAFMKELNRNNPWQFTFEGGRRMEMPPLSQALRNTLLHRLYLAGDGKQREEEAWPFLNDSRRYSPEARDTYRFEDFERKLNDVDMDQLASMREEHRLEGDKLLLIDGRYWVQTPPPVICVDIAGYKGTARADCEITFLPEWIDPRLGREYFPLCEREAALEYARMANDLTPGTDGVGDYVDEAACQETGDPLLWFDSEEYSHRRTTAVLAGDASRQIVKTPELVEKLGDECTRNVLAARDEVVRIGTSVPDWPDLSAFTHDVVDAWKGSGRKPGWADIPQDRRRFGDLICKRASDMVANTPISLHLRGQVRASL